MRQILRISGIAYLLIFIAGFYANFAVLERLVDISNPLNTTLNIFNNTVQFEYGLLGFLVMLLFDILLIWSLFLLTKSINNVLSYLASLFRLLHAFLFSYALLKLWKLYNLIVRSSTLESIQNRVMELILDFNTIWTIGLVCFGMHLILLSYLIMRSNYIPKIIGYLMVLAALGYLIDSIAKLTLTNYNEYSIYFESGVILFGVTGELSLTIWLLIKGFSPRNVNRHKNLSF